MHSEPTSSAAALPDSFLAARDAGTPGANSGALEPAAWLATPERCVRELANHIPVRHTYGSTASAALIRIDGQTLKHRPIRNDALRTVGQLQPIAPRQTARRNRRKRWARREISDRKRRHLRRRKTSTFIPVATHCQAPHARLRWARNLLSQS